MGWFSDAVSSVSNAVAPIVNVVTAPVKAAVDIVQGENVAESIGKAVAAPYTVAQSYAKMAGLNLSGIPLVGGIAQKNIDSGAAINAGDAGFRELSQFGYTSALGAGGYLAGSALAGGAISPTTAGLGVLGYKALNGDTSGITAAIDAYTGLPISQLVPNKDLPGGQDVTPIGDYLENPSIPDVPGLNKKSNLNPAAIAVIGGVLLGAYYFARKK